MDNFKNFQPNTEEERQFMELYNGISIQISEAIRGLSQDKRLPYLKASEPTDLSLMNLYLQALKKEDYETCTVSKELLVERGFKIPE